MRGGCRWAVALVVMGAVWAAGCTPGNNDVSEKGSPGLDTPREDGSKNPVPDAGPVERPDAGTPAPDGGMTPPPPANGGTTPPPPTDGGTTPPPPTDGGTTPVDGGPPPITIVFPPADGWIFLGTQHGGPRRVYGVTADEGGNIWVAGGEEGLFLLKPGTTQYRRFTMDDGLRPYGYMPDGSAPPGEKYLKVISVAGGPAGTVFVGYEGKPGANSDHCENNWDFGNPPDPSRYKSGDADRVTLNADGQTLSVVHYDISTGPEKVAAEPRGREKLCTIMRIAYDKHTNSVWFGGNHGFAWGKANFPGYSCPPNQWDYGCSGVMEHVHPAINAIGSSGEVVLLTDNYYGVGIHPSGDIFFGGANRSTRFRYGTSNNNYWRAQSLTEGRDQAGNRFDIWRDAVDEPRTPRESERRDDNVSGMSVAKDGTVWVSSFTQGLARMDDEGHVLRTYGQAELGTTALNTVASDPSDGSVWAGDRWVGVVYRLKDNTLQNYGCSVFGRTLCGSRIADIQVDTSTGKRRMLVAFMGNEKGTIPGAIGIYLGD